MVRKGAADRPDRVFLLLPLCGARAGAPATEGEPGSEETAARDWVAAGLEPRTIDDGAQLPAVARAVRAGEQGVPAVPQAALARARTDLGEH